VKQEVHEDKSVTVAKTNLMSFTKPVI